MKKYLLLASLALSAIIPGAAALAADMDLPPPPPPVTELRPANYDWTGAYAGVLLGSSCIDGQFTYSATGGTFLNAGCGFKGGLLAGYNLQMDNIVWGIDGSVETTNNIVTNSQVGADFKYGFDYIGRINARVGYAMDDTLFFMTAGGAYAQAKLTDNVTIAPNDLTANHFGWSVGAGVEHALTDELRFRMDYLYTRFSDATYQTACCTIDGGPKNEHEVRAAVIWAF
jgi:outer membrane immunogenic protein